MASNDDRWFFLLTLAAMPIACTDDEPQLPTTDGSSSTTAAPSSTETTDAEGSTSIVTTTGLDGTSSSGGESTTTDASSSGTTGSSSSDGTTMSIEPSTSSSEGSSTGEPLGLCELWGETRAGCYGYYNPTDFVDYCYYELLNIDPLCVFPASQLYQCQAAGCFVDCSTEDDALDACNDLVLAMQLGCDVIPLVPGAGTIDSQCTSVATQAFACDAAGYYIPGFSQYVGYSLDYAVNFCTYGAYFTFLFPPPPVGDSCGGAYEELLTCLSGLSCSELESAMFPGSGYCTTQEDALTCRCELGA